ncbi:MAG: class I SAM-dependent rRNA methyltransferase [Verrucomicrobiota bacterium]|nr:class I SAM-dependent rRNA methyltransferase [Verrucomicrobiota bacterium]
MQQVILKKGRERSLLQNRHPWIFSGAIASYSSGFQPGDVAQVYSAEKIFLGLAYFHPSHSLAGRILSWEEGSLQEIIRGKIEKAHKLRSLLFDKKKTNAFRVINAEADGLPGLIVDLYNDILVLQIQTLGMERLRSLIVEALIETLSPRGIYEKSVARDKEGLQPHEAWLFGTETPEIEVLEYGLPFLVSLTEGQKTGCFLDQREMRRKVGELSQGRSLLNLFSYSGGFSLHALEGGARSVVNVDICPRATRLCKQNLSRYPQERVSCVQEDVFSFLQSEDLSKYEVIVLDPPAFAKSRGEIPGASQGYRALHRAIFSKSAPGTLLVTSSCSYFIDPSLFQHLIFTEAAKAKREVQILSRHLHAPDHPISLYHPEGEYLKSLILHL